jgi:hypothetical protein
MFFIIVGEQFLGNEKDTKKIKNHILYKKKLKIIQNIQSIEFFQI